MLEMRKNLRRLVTVCFILAISITTSAALAGSPEFVQIISIDSYSKSVPAGHEVQYNWTLRSVTNDNLTVEVRVSLSGEGWTANVTPHTQTLAPNGLGAVRLTVRAPLESGTTTSNATVTFLVYDAGYLIQVETFYAKTSISGVLASADKVLGLFENPLPAPLNNEWGVFMLNVVFWLAIAFAITYTFDSVLKAFTRKTTTMIDDIIIGIVRTPLILIIFTFGALQSLDALHRWIPEDIRNTLASIYQIVLVLVIFYLAYKIFKEVVLYYGKLIAKKTSSKIDDILIPVIEKVGIVVIGLAALGYVLNILSVDLTMFVAGGVVVSMVLAFAAQETLSNFFSGMFILLDRPFAEGDTVILPDGDWCEIRKIGLRTTRMYRYSDATMVTMPNNKLVNEKIIRVTNVEDPARINVSVGVAYGTDPAKAKEAILKAIRSSPYSLLDRKDKEPMILFDELGDFALIFKVICWINDPGKRMQAKDRLIEEIYKKLNEANIEIPFPQRVVHLKKVD